MTDVPGSGVINIPEHPRGRRSRPRSRTAGGARPEVSRATRAHTVPAITHRWAGTTTPTRHTGPLPRSRYYGICERKPMKICNMHGNLQGHTHRDENHYPPVLVSPGFA